EVALAPRIDMVELQGVLDAPGLGGVELASAVQGALRIYGHVRESAVGPGEFTWPRTIAKLRDMFIGESRRDDFRETLRLSPRARKRLWPVVYWQKSSRPISARPHDFHRGPGSGPGPLCSATGDGALGVADPFAPGAGVEARAFEAGALESEQVVACGHSR